MWVQMRKSRVKPYSHDIHTYLEEFYKTNLQLIDENPNDETILHTKYQMNEYRVYFLV
jgi:ADP-glucose pyrophosphorylase